MNNFTVIAEIGCTHIGSLERAKELAKLAKICNADVIKTQKRNPKESTNKKLWDKPHPNQMFSYGKTYLEHRENVELSIEDHYKLKEYCEEIGIEYSTSVWDMTSIKEVIDLNPKMIKIPSACNNNFGMIEYLLDNYNGEVHISTGMLTTDERKELYKKLPDTVVVYLCTSGYPVPFKQLYLNEIKELTKIFTNVGFSNHGFGIATEPVAYCLGARYFERHFIDNRCFAHTDASCSLEPQGLNKMIRNLRATVDALQYKPDMLDDIENVQRLKLRIT